MKQVRIIGIDLAPKNTGVFAVTYYRQDGNILSLDIHHQEIRTEKQDLFSFSYFLQELENIIYFSGGTRADLIQIEAPTQQIHSMVSVDIGYNVGILSYWLYEQMELPFVFVEPGKMYKWVGTHNRDKQRKKKTREYARTIFGIPNLSGNEAEAAIHSMIGFHFWDHIFNKPVWKSLSDPNKLDVLTNKRKKGLLDQQKYKKYLRMDVG